MSAATFVHCNTAAALDSVARTHAGWPLVVTGHSMGGTTPGALSHDLSICSTHICVFVLRCGRVCVHACECMHTDNNDDMYICINNLI